MKGRHDDPRFARSCSFCASLFAANAQGHARTSCSKKPITLPGVEADGAVRLPNSWSIKPAGKQIELGDFPINIALHPSGKWAAILHAGYGEHEVVIVDLTAKKERVKSRVVIDQTFGGICFVGGHRLYVGGGEFDVVHGFDFADGFLSGQRTFKVADTKFIPRQPRASRTTGPFPLRPRRVRPRASSIVEELLSEDK